MRKEAVVTCLNTGWIPGLMRNPEVFITTVGLRLGVEPVPLPVTIDAGESGGTSALSSLLDCEIS
jgi:hypothetical protein